MHFRQIFRFVETPNQKPRALLVFLGWFLLLLVAVPCWVLIPNGNSNSIDAVYIYELVSQLFTWGKPFDLSVANPFQGLVNVFLPFNVWLNPGYYIMGLSKYPLFGTFLGHLFLVSEFYLGIFFLLFVFGLSEIWAVVLAQFISLSMFDPFNAMMGFHNLFAGNPGLANTLSAGYSLLAVFGLIGRQKLSTNVVLVFIFSVGSFYLVLSDPVWTPLVAINLAVFACTFMVAAPRHELRWKAGAVFGTLFFALIFGIHHYYSGLQGYMARQFFGREIYVERQDFSYVTMGLKAFPGGYFIWIALVGAFFHLFRDKSKTRSPFAFVLLVYSLGLFGLDEIYLYFKKAYTFPLPIYFEVPSIVFFGIAIVSYVLIPLGRFFRTLPLSSFKVHWIGLFSFPILILLKIQGTFLFLFTSLLLVVLILAEFRENAKNRLESLLLAAFLLVLSSDKLYLYIFDVTSPKLAVLRTLWLLIFVGSIFEVFSYHQGTQRKNKNLEIKKRVTFFPSLVVVPVVFWIFVQKGNPYPVNEVSEKLKQGWITLQSGVKMPKTAIIDKLIQEIKLVPGQPFRGSVATSYGVTEEPYEKYTMGRALGGILERFGGNLHSLMYLWFFGIPTLEEYSQVVTPPYHILVSRLLSRPQDLFSRNLEFVTRLNFPVLRAAGVRYIITDKLFSLNGVQKKIDLVAKYREKEKDKVAHLVLYELDNPNLGNYSPTRIEQLGDVQSILARLENEDFDFRNQVILSDREPTKLADLVSADRGTVIFNTGNVQVIGHSMGKSLLLLPMQYSHCLEMRSGNPEIPLPRIFRANLFQSAILFDRAVDVTLSYSFGPLINTSCRKLDIIDFKEMNASGIEQDKIPAQFYPYYILDKKPQQNSKKL